ncbi:outer membrane protein assembly factor BamA [Candidatus Pelagibacter sp. HIMB1509]|uniref:outer membrane protein assembly factor BamA n=1 Tax=Candidatus Pelagibacter sp. HIMB1509 TaxID=3413339 RepID=UPI003F860902
MFKINIQIILLLIINLLFFNSISYSKKFEKILVNGNERIPTETIVVFSGLENIDEINNDEINKSLKNLYKTNFFKDVKIKLLDNNLIIEVKEFPLIENVKIKGVKAKKIQDNLYNELKLKSRSSYNDILLEKDKKNILNFLKNSGYYFSSVDTYVIELDDNKVSVEYKIDLGEKAKIKKISFIGNKKFKDNKLRSVIVSEEYKFWKILSGKKFLNENLINLDQRLLKNFYLNKGYYDVQINSSFGKYLDDDTFELIFNINAKEKLFFNDLAISIPKDFDPNNFTKLNKIFSKIKGSHYSLNTVEQILDEINIITLDEEFQSINAIVNESIIDNKINLEFIIKETDKITVKRINVLGNDVTRENVIRNNFELDEGDPYNEILLKRTENNLKSLNFFSDVKVEAKDSDEINSKTIDITVKEKPTGELYAGAGVGTNGGTISFGVRENNYLGKGMQVESNLTITSETIKGNLNLYNPNLNNSDKSIFLDLEALEIDRTKTSGYKTNKTGFSTGTKFEYLSDFNFGLSGKSTFENIETNSTASSQLKKQKGNFWDTFLNLDFDYDKRNQKYKTTKGFRSSYNLNIPVISEVSTLTNSYTYNYYTELYEDNITNLTIFLKSANSIKNKDIKISERLFIPSKNLRGFERGKVGPKDGKDFIGGNYVGALNISTTVPKLFENLQELDFLMFFDAANIWGVDYNSTLENDDKIRSSIGIGVDWFTPLGPLNFSFAETLSKSSSDITETFRFNLGTTF